MTCRQRSKCCASFFGILDDVLVDPFDQGVLHPLGDRRVAPGKIFAGLLLAVALDRFGKFQQPVGRIGAAIQQHVFDTLQQIFGDLFVDFQLPGIDDAHVQAGLDGVVQETQLCIASRTRSLPRKLKLMLLTPPLVFAPGHSCLIRRTASMKSTA